LLDLLLEVSMRRWMVVIVGLCLASAAYGDADSRRAKELAAQGKRVTEGVFDVFPGVISLSDGKRHQMQVVKRDSKGNAVKRYSLVDGEFETIEIKHPPSQIRGGEQSVTHRIEVVPTGHKETVTVATERGTRVRIQSIKSERGMAKGHVNAKKVFKGYSEQALARTVNERYTINKLGLVKRSILANPSGGDLTVGRAARVRR
jgi:hypothetical protein